MNNNNKSGMYDPGPLNLGHGLVIHDPDCITVVSKPGVRRSNGNRSLKNSPCLTSAGRKPLQVEAKRMAPIT